MEERGHDSFRTLSLSAHHTPISNPSSRGCLACSTRSISFTCPWSTIPCIHLWRRIEPPLSPTNRPPLHPLKKEERERESESDIAARCRWLRPRFICTSLNGCLRTSTSSSRQPAQGPSSPFSPEAEYVPSEQSSPIHPFDHEYIRITATASAAGRLQKQRLARLFQRRRGLAGPRGPTASWNEWEFATPERDRWRHL